MGTTSAGRRIARVGFGERKGRDRAWREAPACVVEELELRRLLAVIAWDGGGDGKSWADEENWIGNEEPGVDDDAVIVDVPGNTPILFNDTATIRSVTCTEPFKLQGGSLTVTVGVSSITGEFEMTGGALVAQNTGTALTISDTAEATSVSASNVNADGGQISFTDLEG